MSVGEVSLGDMSVGEVSLGDMSVGEVSLSDMSVGEWCAAETTDTHTPHSNHFLSIHFFREVIKRVTGDYVTGEKK